MSVVRKGLKASLALVSFVAATSAARAGDFGDLSGTQWQIGGFVFAAPKFEGSKDYEVLGFPYISPANVTDSSGWIQVNGADDVRLRLFQFSGFEIGPLAGWRFDRDENDSSHLDGLGDVDGGLVIGGYVAYRAWPIAPFVSYHHQVTGDDTGGVVRFGGEVQTPLSNDIKLTTTVGASYADDSYMDAYFSVTSAQSAASTAGLDVYDADAGIKDVFIGVTGDMPLSGPWFLKLSGRYSRLVGDAADSPVVQDENQFFGGVGISYRFGQ